MKKDHPDAYPANAQFTISSKMLRDQITSGARTVLLVLLAASGLESSLRAEMWPT
jgi:hypothetical protein